MILHVKFVKLPGRQNLDDFCSNFTSHNFFETVHFPSRATLGNVVIKVIKYYNLN